MKIALDKIECKQKSYLSWAEIFSHDTNFCNRRPRTLFGGHLPAFEQGIQYESYWQLYQCQTTPAGIATN